MAAAAAVAMAVSPSIAAFVAVVDAAVTMLLFCKYFSLLPIPRVIQGPYEHVDLLERGGVDVEHRLGGVSAQDPVHRVSGAEAPGRCQDVAVVQQGAGAKDGRLDLLEKALV